LGRLFVVATPIGNLEDLSPRAMRTLSEVSLIAAEDTRHTGKLLTRFGISTPVLSYHAFNARARERRLLDVLATGDVALVSDSGTPGISDPGLELIDAALDAGIEVRAIPGPSSLSAAISISGLIDGPFVFLGFLPRRAGERNALIDKAIATGFGFVLFESPQRLRESLGKLSTACRGRRYAVVRELSKIHEEVLRGRFGDDDFGRFDGIRGEIVVVIEGGEPALREIDPETELRARLAAGDRPNDAAKAVAAASGRPKSEIYRLALELVKSKAEPVG
jgi:16S rRNA (cytidine1402-2'-O)-methyltransferase